MGEEAAFPLTKFDGASTLPPIAPPPPIEPPPSNKITTSTWMAIFSYLFSVPLLCYGIWLLFTRDYQCQSPLNMPHLREMVGVGLIVAFVISCFVTHYGSKVVLPGALTLAVALLVMLTLGIVLIGSYSMESRGMPASPLWVRARIENIDTWSNVKNCIYEMKTCPDLAYNTIELSAVDFSKKKLDAIERGCCKPPSVCGMQYVNATYWMRMNEENGIENNSTSNGSFATPATNVPTSSSAWNSTINPNTYGDCSAWSNKITQLCYDCQSCKEAFILTIHHNWWSHGFFLIFMSVLLLLVHTPRFILTMMQRNMS